MSRWYTNPRCSDCGLFTSWDADSYVPFGGAEDTEPDDPRYLCPKCHEQEIADGMERGRPWDHWVKSDADREVARRLGLREARPKGCAWSVWMKELPPPNDIYRSGWEWASPASSGGKR